MQNNLLSIFNAITPDNIKNIPIIEDSMRIFIELLQENSPISADIKLAVSEKTNSAISEELIKIYLWDYFSTIENLKNSKNVVSKFRNWNAALKPGLYPVGLPYIGDKLIINYFLIGEAGSVLTTEEDSNESSFNLNPLSDKLQTLQSNLLKNSPENYYVNRLFKQSKGLKKGIKFIYDIMNEHLVSTDERRELELQETGNPFELYITGSLDKDIYINGVAYASHPLGFIYDYVYISELKFEDNYSLLKSYKINQLEVRCLSGNVEVYNKEVISIIDKTDYLKILFIDNSYLLQENDTVKYYDGGDTLIKIYPSSNHCSVYVDYEIVYNSTLDDYAKYTISDTENDYYPDITDIDEAISFFDSLELKINYVVGLSFIGEELITNDTDSLEYLIMDLNEEFSIEII